MSDTPRTDAEAFLPHDSKYRVCDADFARQLERELNAANEHIKRLEEENDEMRADLLLWGDSLRLQQRINRLEEENEALRADLLLWNEKEVK